MMMNESIISEKFSLWYINSLKSLPIGSILCMCIKFEVSWCSSFKKILFQNCTGKNVRFTYSNDII